MPISSSTLSSPKVAIEKNTGNVAMYKLKENNISLDNVFDSFGAQANKNLSATDAWLKAAGKGVHVNTIK